jgi:hypothetical protein
MFGRKVQCPVESDGRAQVEEAFVRLTQVLAVPIGSGSVILPTSEFFPGPFAAEPEQMQALVDYVGATMRWGDGGHVTAVPFARKGGGAVARGLTGCVGYSGGAFRGGAEASVVALDQALAARPVALVATIAHMLGHLRFVGRPGVPADRAARELLIELHAVLTGFGIFGANAAVEREIDASVANRHAAASHGLRQDRPVFHHSGYLTEQTHGYALACFAFTRGESHPKWMKHLDTNPRAYMRQSLAYLEHQPSERLLAIRDGSIPEPVR